MNLKKYHLVLIHILGWIIFLVLQYYLFSQLHPETPKPPVDRPQGSRPLLFIPLITLNILPYALVFYLNYSLFIPRYYFRKKYGLYFLFVILSCLSILLLPQLIKIIIPPPVRNVRVDRFETSVIIIFFKATIIIRILFITLAVLLSFILRIGNRYREAEKNRVKAELSLLRYQINPHFLFNALNSIYALSLKSNSPVSDYILKLSSMLRYSMPENPSDHIPLKAEMDYIENYILLQKIRLPENIQLEYSVHGNIGNQEIAPVILIAFIENCFKHGISTSERASIYIHISIQENEIQLVTENKIFERTSTDESGNIGIKNTVERLKILYPDRYTLSHSAEGDIYKVILSIVL